MTPADLDILIQQGEGTTLEFKESLSSSFSRELVAMANTVGGKLLLGVRDDGTVSGVKDSNTLRARVQDIARNCDPPVKVLVEPVDDVLAVHVRESDAKPVQCSEGFFWRQGAVTQKLSRDEIRDFFRSEGVIRFDLSPCPRFSYPEDFDRKKYDAWLKLSGISGQPPVEDVLVNIEVAERAGDKLLFRNAGVLFFAKNVRHFFPEAYITCLLGKGTDKVHILDRRDFDGGIVADIEDALSFIDRNTRTAYRIESLRRENIPEYPMKALREAITNAVMHRDWFFEGANVFVEIYANRIEVISPGTLPTGLKMAELGRESIRRNPLIADLLHRIEFIEKAGTGIRRIRDEAREQGCPEPEFKIRGTFFVVVFRPDPEVRALEDQDTGEVTMQDTGEVTIQDTGEVTPQVTGEVTPYDTPYDTPHDTPYDTPHDTGIVRLLEVISGSGEMNRKQIQEALGLKNTKHVRKTYLLPALQDGLIEMTIPDKPRSKYQRYRLTTAGREYLQKSKGQDNGED